MQASQGKDAYEQQTKAQNTYSIYNTPQNIYKQPRAMNTSKPRHRYLSVTSEPTQRNMQGSQDTETYNTTSGPMGTGNKSTGTVGYRSMK